KADVSADVALDGDGCALRLKTPEGELDMRLPLLGKHSALNALGATAAALAAGAALPEVRAGLEKLKAVSGRLEVKPGINGTRVIDDTYNANPASLAAGLQVLRDFPGERALVLGDMAELGSAAVDIHRRVGELAKGLGIQKLFALGELSRHAVETFGRGARHFDNPETLVDALLDCLHGEMTVLVKGSRVMRMERVVAGITRPNGAGGER
ncbi:MAG: cyanophycin synthetase, partial [Pseudomonadota bacterium]